MAFMQHLWSLLTYVVPFVAVLSVVVFFHELGHFLVGRWCGVKVNAFSLGFGPEIASYTDRKGTRWRLAAFPLGGYVAFHGDANAASMSDAEQEKTMSPEERRISLHGQSVGRRAAIVAAGPIANFLLAIVIFTGSFYFFGRNELTPRLAEIDRGGAAEAAGFKAGDLVIAINGKPIDSWNEMQRAVHAANGDEAIVFLVRRDRQEIELTATPKRRDIDTPFGKNRAGVLGVKASADRDAWWRREFSFPQAAVEGVKETWFVVERTGAYVAGLFTGRETIEQVSGPLRIAEVSGAVAKISLVALINLAAILSVSVGLLNLFPIPPLDGGHLLYFAAEAVKGRPLSQAGQELGFRVGVALVLGLMAFATFNDILHVGPKLLKLFG